MSLEFKIGPSSLDGSVFIPNPLPPTTTALGLRWRPGSSVTVELAGWLPGPRQIVRNKALGEVLSSDAYYACLYVYTCMVCMLEMP